MKLEIIPPKLTILKLNYDSDLPDWIYNSDFFSVTRTPDELSVVCDLSCLPKNVTSEHSWVAIKVQGTLDFSLIGVLSELSGILAEEKISIFAISTYNTDYILVNEQDKSRAVKVLQKHHEIIA